MKVVGGCDPIVNRQEKIELSFVKVILAHNL